MFQAKNPFLMQSRLRIEHMGGNKFAKMRVQPSEAIFSHGTAAALRTMVTEYGDKYGFDHDDFTTTAWFISKVARWYELMTSRNPQMAFSYKDMDKFNAAVTDINDFVDIVQQTAFNPDSRRVPFQYGVALVSRSMIDIVVDLLDLGNIFSKIIFHLMQRAKKKIPQAGKSPKGICLPGGICSST